MPANDDRSSNYLSPRERVLALQPLFASDEVDVRAILELAMFGRESVFSPGELLLHGRDDEEDVLFITEGTVAVQYHEAGVSRLMEAPGVLGTVNRFTRLPVRLSARAQTDVLALRIPFERLTQVVVRYGSVALTVASRLAEQVQLMRGQLPVDPYPVTPPILRSAADLGLPDEVDCLLAVRRSGLFQASSADAVGSLLRHSVVKRVPAGSVLWEEDQSIDEIVFIVAGGLRASTRRSFPDVLIEPGHFAGQLARLLRTTNPQYRLTAEVDSILLAIDVAGARSVVEDHANLLFDMIGTMSRLVLSLPANYQTALELVLARRRSYDESVKVHLSS